MKRIIGIVLAVLLIGGVAATVVAGRESQDSGTATKTVRGVIGSEKAEFFADPEVVKALTDELRKKSKVTGAPIRPFYSPLVVVAHRSAAKVLADNGLATLTGKGGGTLRMGPYLAAARADRTWQQLKGPRHTPS